MSQEKGREPGRPHYLGDWMAQFNIGRGALIDGLGVDKSYLSKWLDEDHPTTPSKRWAIKLNAYIGRLAKQQFPIDIFKHPEDAWFAYFTHGRSADEKRRIKETLTTAFPRERDQK